MAVPAAAAAASDAPCVTTSDGEPTLLDALPPVGTPRRASLTNPPTPIPARILTLYQQAAARSRVPWPLLAGVGMAETNHGHLTATSSAGARGLMQFLPATFAAYGVDADGDGRATIDSDADSIHSAARYLAASGATRTDGIRRALYAYNHATWYVNDVLHYAHHYQTDACEQTPDDPASTRAPSGAGVPGACPPTGSTAERGLQPATLHALRCTKRQYPWIRSMGGRGYRPNTSDHPAGRAVDFMIPNWNTRAGNTRGWQVARWLQHNARTLRVKYVIYDDKVWRAYRPTAGWTPYTHPNGSTRNPTLRHLDHVHLSVDTDHSSIR
ncbi:MAG: lytic transglycosylase domain-containing protein [Nigerium sp.]|nr:lytic transglycosylase domain-containing protein [Nigerium sp.]